MSDLPVDSAFAGYRIERKLGVGGMGTVYLARNPDLPRSEALKVLSTELSRDPGFRARFIREADVAASLDHPNVVSVHQRGDSHRNRDGAYERPRFRSSQPQKELERSERTGCHGR